MSTLAGGYRPGDWVVVVPSPEDVGIFPPARDPPHGTVVRVLGFCANEHHPVMVAWDSGHDAHGKGRWPMCLSQIRLATQEEVAQAHLGSLDGL